MTKLDFKISSGLKNIIGKELITDDFIAIFELVKNSYDANAKTVQIIFENIKPENRKKGSKIFIIDDGEGMTLNDIQNKWLFIAYSDKKDLIKEMEKTEKDFRDKIQQKRIKAGAKGIGRFSCDRLGSELNLFTKKNHEKIFHKLYTNWKKFEEDTTKEFQTVKVDYDYLETLNEEETLPVQNLQKGTILEIYSLNSEWSQDKLIKLKRYLQRLINPIEINDSPQFEIILQSQEFLDDDEKARKKGKDHEIINGPIKNIVFERLGIKTTQINCSIDPEGKVISTELIDKGEFIFGLEEKNEYPLLSNIKIKLFYLNKQAKQSFSKRMGIEPIRYGSIFVYKNQFRILPYGDENNDWLELEKRKTQGQWRYLATREVIGRVEIIGKQSGFDEVSSRNAGFYKSENFDQLKAFLMDKILKRLEKFVVEGIKWDSENKPITQEEIDENSLKIINDFLGKIKDSNKKVVYSKKLLDLIERKQVESLPQSLKRIQIIKDQLPDDESKQELEKHLDVVASASKTLQKEKDESQKHVKLLQKDIKATETENLFLIAISSEDKRDIIALQHQIGISTSNIGNYLEILKKYIEIGIEIPKNEIEDIIEKISLETKKITMIVKFITKATFELKREEVKLDLALFIKQYVENVYTQLEEMSIDHKHVKVNVHLQPDFKAECYIKPLEFAIIIDNLINNSLKAAASKVDLSIKKFGTQGIELIVSDDGQGIPEENINRLFNFGFTTTSGSGIGLYHVKDIITKMNGSIEVNKLIKTGAEFVIRIKQLKVEE